MKLYYENPYLKEFNAIVTGCVAAKDGYAITLSRTAFYPEGGGQPYDTGFIGETVVDAVRERDGEVMHYVGTPFQVGSEVQCKIDWERRFPLMQEHTGEHILSGIILKHYKLSNVGFHMGSEFVSIDVNGSLSGSQLTFVEEIANKAIYDNIRVLSEFKTPEELENLNYRSKGNIDGDVRIVQIGEYDTCACCGIHCQTTGEVGVIKIINSMKYKLGTRIFILCGERAMADYAEKNESVYEISRLLSAKPSEVSVAVRQLMEENVNLRSNLSIFKNRVFSAEADRIPENTGLVCLFESGLTSDELRRLCTMLCSRAAFAAVFSGGDNAYKYALGSKTLDTRKIAASLNEKLSGRGGGKSELVQGSVTGSEATIKKTIESEYAKIFAL